MPQVQNIFKRGWADFFLPPLGEILKYTLKMKSAPDEKNPGHATVFDPKKLRYIRSDLY